MGLGNWCQEWNCCSPRVLTGELKPQKIPQTLSVPTDPCILPAQSCSPGEHALSWEFSSVEGVHLFSKPPICPPLGVRCTLRWLTMCKRCCYICKVPRVKSGLPVM